MPEAAPKLDQVVGLGYSYLERGETVRARFRPAGRLVLGEGLQSLLGAIIAALVLAAFPYYAIESQQVSGPEAFATFAVAVLVPEAIFILQRTGRAIVEVLFTEYVWTDRRLYATTAFLSRKTNVLPFEKITNLQIRRSLFERMLGVAEVRVVAYGVRGTELRLRGLRDPAPLFSGLSADVKAHASLEALLARD